MKFEDTSQNLRARLRFVQILVVLMLGVLSVRLYVLQVVRGDRYAEIAQNQRRRRLPIPAPRGVIFDRDKTRDRRFASDLQRHSFARRRERQRLDALVEPLSNGLTVDQQILSNDLSWSSRCRRSSQSR